MLDPTGAAFWPAKRVLITADLPLDAGAARGGAGQVPDPRATLERLNRLVRLYRPAKVVILGEGSGVPGATRTLAATEHARLEAMSREASFIWVVPNPETAALPGQCVAVYREGAFTFRHEASSQLGPREIEISGFHHPKASIDARGKRVSRPCFVADSHRLILPAFGSPAGRLDVRDGTIARLFPRGLRVFLLGQDQLFSFALEQLGRMAEVA
jgi:metallophosphoesterase superfamily enzyme